MTREVISARLAWPSMLGLLACAYAAAQPVPGPACPTCAPRPAGAFNSEPRGIAGVGPCFVEASLTPADVERFELEPLRAMLARPQAVEGFLGYRSPSLGATAARRTFRTELELEAGAFRYYKAAGDPSCPRDFDQYAYVEAPARVQVRVEDGLLLFTMNGTLTRMAGARWATFFGLGDLAAAASNDPPELHTSQPHAADITLNLHVFPSQLRGEIVVDAFRFDDEEQLRRHFVAPGQQGERSNLLRLNFPNDACSAHELPVAYDAATELLYGQSAQELRARAASLIDATTTVDAVWHNRTRTQVTVELGEPIEGTACVLPVGSPDWTIPYPSRAVRVAAAGRLRSADGRIDMPLHELVIGIGDNAISGATLKSWVSTAAFTEAQKQALDEKDARALEAVVLFDLDGEPGALDGIVRLQEIAREGFYMPMDCVAFPRGGELDRDYCRRGGR